MRVAWIYILFFTLLFISPTHSQKLQYPFDPLWEDTRFVSSGRDSIYVLPHRFLIPGSVIVQLNSLIMGAKADYEADHRRGEIRFFHPPDSGKTIIITYRRFPVDIQLQYRHWISSDTVVTSETDTSDVLQMMPQEEKKRIDFGKDLHRSGSIFRGITVGTNQGMRLQSGLRLQLSGMITPKVEVVASLTDQNTPIQPEGNTQTLQEIDKVFVNIKAPGVQTTMGDYVLHVEGSEFGGYSRKLEGAMITAENRSGNITISAAATKGQFTTNHFMGQESNQGPYQLTGSQGQREIIVLAGTERVWIDGELMTRGEENDYTIEYANGQITFTRNRLITSDSRIAVDFEYSDQKYQKAIYGATGEVRLWNDRLKVRTSFLREADDKENPLSVSLTDEYRQVLEAAGDDPDSAVVSGVKFMGEDKGSYDRVDSAGVVFYRYVGSGRGEYTVRFSYVGHGQGDYNFRGYGIFRYEGAGQGSYLPVIYLPLATRHQIADVSASAEIGQGMFVEGEVGFSDLDLNQYSAAGDDDNTDIAYSGRFRMDRRPMKIMGKGLGELGVSANLRSVGDGFRPVGRMAEVEHGRKWGMAEGVTWGEKIHGIDAVYSPFSAWTIEGELGSLRREESFRSERKRVTTDLSSPNLPKIHYSAELIDTEEGHGFSGYWLRQQGYAQWSKWGVSPSIHYLGEHRKDEDSDSARTGFRFDEWTGGLAFQRGIFYGKVEETVRDDRWYDGFSLDKYSLARTDRLQLEFRWKKGISSSIMYTHRNRDYVDPGMEDQDSDLADMKVRVSPGQRVVFGTVHYRFSSTQVSEMVQDTMRVGEGLGSYRYDENIKELVPDADGNILLRMIQTGDFLPINEMKLGGEFRFDGSRLGNNKKGLSKFISAWKTRSLLRIERKDTERSFLSVNRSAFQHRWGADSTLVLGLISFLQDLEYFSSGSDFSMRLRYRKNDSENHQLMQEGLIRHMGEKSIRVKASPVKSLGLLAEYLYRSEEKAYTTGSRSNRDIRSHAWTLEASYRPRQKIEIALNASVKIARDLLPDPLTRAVSFFLSPRFGYAFRQRGHLRAELEMGRVISESSDRTLPYEMFGGDQPGRTWRWNVLMTYRITGHIMATLNYRGRKEPWRTRVYQTGQVEVRAFF